MKVTKATLKQIIKEEIEAMMSESITPEKCKAVSDEISAEHATVIGGGGQTEMFMAYDRIRHLEDSEVYKACVAAGHIKGK